VIDNEDFECNVDGMRLLHGIEFDNTKSIKDKCDSGEYNIPGVKSGNETYSHNIGDRVVSTNLSTIIAGEMGTVVSREMNNGYCRYFVEFDCGTRSTQREQDLYGKDIEFKVIQRNRNKVKKVIDRE
jgi:hypothetical protein